MSILATKFRENVSKMKDYRMKTESEFDVGYSTGFLSFDFLNGTLVHVRTEDKNLSYYSIGLVDGSMVMVIGRTGCGKSTWVVQAAANIIRPFKTSCVFEDNVEGGVTVARREQLTKFYGDELTARYISRSSGITGENFYQRVKMIYDMKMESRSDFEYDTGLYDTRGNRIYKLEPTVYILDSLAMLTADKYSEEDELSGQMATTAGAKMNAMIFRRLIPLLKMANIILLVINHINQKVETGPIKSKSQHRYLKMGETLPAGNTPLYLSTNIVRVDDNSKLKPEEGFGIDGALVDFGLVKSRTSGGGRSVTLVFDQDKGYDEDLSLFYMLKEAGKINGAGIGMYFADRNDMKFSQKNFKEKIKNNLELKQLFISEAVAELKSKLDGKFKEQQLEEYNYESSVTGSIMNLLTA